MQRHENEWPIPLPHLVSSPAIISYNNRIAASLYDSDIVLALLRYSTTCYTWLSNKVIEVEDRGAWVMYLCMKSRVGTTRTLVDRGLPHMASVSKKRLDLVRSLLAPNPVFCLNRATCSLCLQPLGGD